MWPRAPRKPFATKAAASGRAAWAFISISPMPSSVWAAHVIEERYGNLFDMYERITGENPYEVPMRIYPAIHYTMGGLWVDYHLMSTIPGLFVLGEANFSDHGANRLGASALMQGLVGRLFRHPVHASATISPSTKLDKVRSSHPEFETAEEQRSGDGPKRLLSIRGKRTVSFIPSRARQDHVGQLRHGAQRGRACSRPSAKSRSCAKSSGSNVNVLGAATSMNQSLENAGRVADFLELGELMCLDALHRNESCGGHFREEYQTPEGEALARRRRTSRTSAAWEYRGPDTQPVLHKEPLDFRIRSPVASGATSSMRITLHVWRQKNASEPGRMVKYEHGRRQHAHVVSRNARCAERRADRKRAKSPSPSTTIAAKASADRAAS